MLRLLLFFFLLQIYWPDKWPWWSSSTSRRYHLFIHPFISLFNFIVNISNAYLWPTTINTHVSAFHCLSGLAPLLFMDRATSWSKRSAKHSLLFNQIKNSKFNFRTTVLADVQWMNSPDLSAGYDGDDGDHIGSSGKLSQWIVCNKYWQQFVLISPPCVNYECIVKNDAST